MTPLCIKQVNTDGFTDTNAHTHMHFNLTVPRNNGTNLSTIVPITAYQVIPFTLGTSERANLVLPIY